MSVHQTYDERWICAYKGPDNKRHDKSFGRGPDAETSARAFDAEMKAFHAQQVAEANEIITPTVPAEPECAVMFGELVKEYMQHSKSNGSSDNHLSSIAYVSRGVFFPFFGKTKLLADFDYGRDILPFMTKLVDEPSRRGQKRSPITVNQYGHFLIALFNYAIERGYIASNPMRLWKKVKVRQKEIQLTVDDAQKIMEHAAPHLKWAMEVCFTLGTRPGDSELLSLKWSDVDYDKKMVHVYGRKTKTDRFIPVSGDFLARLKAKQAEARTDHIIEFRGRPIRMIRKAFREAVKKARIPYPVRMYDLRHLFATSLLDAGAPVGSVSRLMGHSRISTTVNVYYQTRQEELERAITVLPKLKVTEGHTGS